MGNGSGQYHLAVAGGPPLLAISPASGPMRSVPPRGSGWVSKPEFKHRKPTRYREVVLTSWDATRDWPA